LRGRRRAGDGAREAARGRRRAGDGARETARDLVAQQDIICYICWLENIAQDLMKAHSIEVTAACKCINEKTPMLWVRMDCAVTLTKKEHSGHAAVWKNMFFTIDNRCAAFLQCFCNQIGYAKLTVSRMDEEADTFEVGDVVGSFECEIHFILCNKIIKCYQKFFGLSSSPVQSAVY